MGGDIALFWDLSRSEADFAIIDDDLASDEGMQTAVLLSFALDRRAEDSDTLPTDDGDKRGWWGDEFAENQGDKIGSRRWLLARSKLTPAILPTVEAYDRESLEWLIEDQAAASIDLEYEIIGNRLDTSITVRRGDGTEVSAFYSHIWDGEAARDAPAPDAEAEWTAWSGTFPVLALTSAGVIYYLGADDSVSPDLAEDSSHLYQADRITPSCLDIGTLASGTDFDLIPIGGPVLTTDPEFGEGVRSITAFDPHTDTQRSSTSTPNIPSAQDGTKSFLIGGVLRIDDMPGADSQRAIASQLNPTGPNGWVLQTSNQFSTVRKLRFRTYQGGTIHNALSPTQFTLGVPFAFLCGVDIAGDRIWCMTSDPASYAEEVWADIGSFDSGSTQLYFGDIPIATWSGFEGVWGQFFTFEYDAALDAEITIANMQNFLRGVDGAL